jgi:8-oxo-dGTP pyrophosphatase MutT (NUDIX family)
VAGSKTISCATPGIFARTRIRIPEVVVMGLLRDNEPEIHVVTCFLMRRGKVLILQRSEKVGTFRCKWAGVSGYIEKGERPVDTAFKEIWEETGLSGSNVALVREGAPLPIAFTNFIVHPFLFECKRGRIRLDWEHTAHRWIRPSGIGRFGTVPGLKAALKSVLIPQA